MDPLSFRLMSAAGQSASPVQIDTISWASNSIDTASISGVFFTANETATSSNARAVTGFLPSVTSGGWYLDWQQVEGYSAYVNFVGVSSTTAASYTSSGSTVWYWSSSIWQDNNSSVSSIGNLSAGTHRMAMRTISGLSYVYFRNGNTSTVAGPYLFSPSASPMFTVYSQGGYKVGDVTIANGGAVYSGGGGLF